MPAKLPAFMQCTACKVAYTSGRFCPKCDNKLAAVDQTTFPVVAAPRPPVPRPAGDTQQASRPILSEADRARVSRFVATQLECLKCPKCEGTYRSGTFCPKCDPPTRLVVVEQPMQRAVAADAVEAPAAPAFDTAASVAQGRDCLASCRAAALRVPFVRSHFYATMLASRVEGHRRASFDTMERDGVPDAEARVVIDTLAPDFQALAAAELLGDAASALTRDELAAQLAQLGLGEADDVAMPS